MLVEVVDVLPPRGHHPQGPRLENEVHEVKKVAALLHKRAAAVRLNRFQLFTCGVPGTNHPPGQWGKTCARGSASACVL